MGNAINYRLMSKGWGFFDVMHKDRRVARIYESGKCTINYPSFMPYNLYLEKGDDVETRVQNLNNFYFWCSSRVLTLDRKYAKEILNSIGALQTQTDKERAVIAISYHALSLMDVYWVRVKGEDISFNNLSLYRHSLSDTFVDVTLRGKNLTVQNAELLTTLDKAADLGTPGVAPKAWIRADGDFYLLKDGEERDVQAELLASKIAACFAVDSVAYEMSSFDGVAVSKCRIITSEEKSIVPIQFVELYCLNRGKDVIEFTIGKDAYSYYMMNIIDYLVGNVDRHWGNWGFIVDNKTNKLEKLYPLMDFNKAFLSYDCAEGGVCQTVDRKIKTSQRQAAEEAVCGKGRVKSN